jgi:phosphoglycolate phosphatase
MKLVIFDCDGTLVDSQNAIIASISKAFSGLGIIAPTRAQILSVVGLSLSEAFAVLAHEHEKTIQQKLACLFRENVATARAQMKVEDPLFAGAKETVQTLTERDDIVLGIATGKSGRGVARILEREGWQGAFFTVQTADDHPSKPHPSMIEQAMAEAGVGPEATVMIGDTSYDMEMARRATVGAVGVAWGYHPVRHLEQAGAHIIVPEIAALVGAIDGLFADWEARS